MTDPIDLPATLARFDEPGPLGPLAVLNVYDIRVVKAMGEFTRHRHPEADEVFGLSGSLTIRLDDDEVTLGPGQLSCHGECTTSRFPSTARTSSSSNRERRQTLATPPATSQSSGGERCATGTASRWRGGVG